MEDIISNINKYHQISKKLDQNNKLYSNIIFKEWIKNDKNKDNRKKFIDKTSELVNKLELLKNTIKFKIDRYYYDNKINFIEIEKEFRDKNVPAYLISQPKEPELKNTKTVNSDNEPVDFTTVLVITDDENIFKETLGLDADTDNEQFKKRVDVNLDMLIQSGIVVIDNNKEDDVKTTLQHTLEEYISQETLNDY